MTITDDDNGLDLKIDAANNLYLIGNFGSPTITFPNGVTFINPDDSSDALENSTDAFIAKFDAGGSNLWTENLANSRTVGGSQIAVTGAGDIYLAGYFFDTATFQTQPTPTTLVENESDNDDSFAPVKQNSKKPSVQPDDEEQGTGGYITKLDTNGDFIWAKGFGGASRAVALAPDLTQADGVDDTKVYVAGAFYDGGTFGAGTPNEESLASFGGEDSFIARYDAAGGFDFAKPIAATGLEGQVAVGKPGAPTENTYSPLGVAYNPFSNSMFISSDFSGAVALDCLTLRTPGDGIQSYVAEISDAAGSCRIWNGLDSTVNDWEASDNWNGGVVPAPNDSVYVPYTGSNDDAPNYNPSSDIPLTTLTVGDDRILTLGNRNLTVNNRLDLLGGDVDANVFTVLLGGAAQTLSVSEGRVLGRVQKQFDAGGGSFTFPVGTENGYSPVTLSNIAGAGSFSVVANEGQYDAAPNLPAERIACWWNLTNGGLTRADLTFQYMPDDYTGGDENLYRAHRIPAGGGTATQVNSSVNTFAHTVFAPNVSEFSDWTISPPAAPTAALVSVSGRVSNGLRALARARVLMTDKNGVRRFATTNPFGFYRFGDVPAGETHVIKASAKRYEFAPQVVSVNEEVNDLNFTQR